MNIIKPKMKPKTIKGTITAKYNNDIFIKTILFNAEISSLYNTNEVNKLETIKYQNKTYHVLKQQKTTLEILKLHLGSIKDLQ